jgi:hypothetical protein
VRKLKTLVCVAAIAVLGICIYSFLAGNEVFDGKFKNDYVAWYFLAKGIFSSLALYLLVRILEALAPRSAPEKNDD